MALSKLDIPIDFEAKGQLGEGAFGSVYLLQGRFFLAVKEIKKYGKDGKDNLENVNEEVRILEKLRSEYVVKVLEVVTEPQSYLIFMEYMSGGTLDDVIAESPSGYLCETQATYYSKQLLRAMDFIHKGGVMHRDIKPANILLDTTRKYVKLADFGSAKDLRPDENTKSLCGTLLYMSPEQIRQEYGANSELWSVGIIIIKMLTGRVPYEKLKDLEFMFLVGNGNGKYELPDRISPQMAHLVDQLLDVHPEIRPSASRALQHKLFNREHYISQPYKGKEQDFSLIDTGDNIGKKAFDMQLPIYAVDSQIEWSSGEIVYHNTGVYWIPDVMPQNLLFVHDERLSSRLFPVITFDSCMENDGLPGTAVSMSAAKRFFDWIDVISKRLNPTTNIEGDQLLLYLDEGEASNCSLDAIANEGAAKINIKFLIIYSETHRPIANLSSLLQHFGNLGTLFLIGIDLREEEHLAEALKCLLRLACLLLWKTEIKEEVLIEVVGDLKHSLQMLAISYEKCLKTPNACARFWRALKHSSTIAFLSVYFDSLNESHLRDLLDVLPTMTALQEVKLTPDFAESDKFLERLESSIGSELAEKVRIVD